MVGHGEKLTRLQEAAIGALLANTSITKAAAAIHVNEKTLRTWLKQPHFQQAHQAARQEALQKTVDGLLARTEKALATLDRGMDGEASVPEIRAAAIILDHILKGVELVDHGRRLAAIEGRINGIESPAHRTH
jgi:hypothetical protein